MSSSSPLLSPLFSALGRERWRYLQDSRALIVWGLQRWPALEARLAVSLALDMESWPAGTAPSFAPPHHDRSGPAGVLVEGLDAAEDASEGLQDDEDASEGLDAAELLIARALRGRAHLRPGCAVCGARATTRIGQRWRCDACGSWRSWTHPTWLDARDPWLAYLEERGLDYGRLKRQLRACGRLGPHQMDEVERDVLRSEIEDGSLDLDTIRRSEGS